MQHHIQTCGGVWRKGLKERQYPVAGADLSTMLFWKLLCCWRSPCRGSGGGSVRLLGCGAVIWDCGVAGRAGGALASASISKSMLMLACSDQNRCSRSRLEAGLRDSMLMPALLVLLTIALWAHNRRSPWNLENQNRFHACVPEEPKA